MDCVYRREKGILIEVYIIGIFAGPLVDNVNHTLYMLYYYPKMIFYATSQKKTHVYGLYPALDFFRFICLPHTKPDLERAHNPKRHHRRTRHLLLRHLGRAPGPIIPTPSPSQSSTAKRIQCKGSQWVCPSKKQ
jgi:hypothetical protein